MQKSQALRSHKECRVCGKVYLLGHCERYCACGGYLYTVSLMYQPKIKKSSR